MGCGGSKASAVAPAESPAKAKTPVKEHTAPVVSVKSEDYGGMSYERPSFPARAAGGGRLYMFVLACALPYRVAPFVGTGKLIQSCYKSTW